MNKTNDLNKRGGSVPLLKDQIIKGAKAVQFTEDPVDQFGKADKR